MAEEKRLDGQSMDNIAARIAALKQVVPEAFREGRLDYDMLEEALGNVGFRLFRLDSSNWKPWDYSFVSPDEPELFVERKKTGLDNIKPSRHDIDIVHEVILKYGVPLTEKLSTLDVEGKRFYAVGETGYLLICLDKNLTSEVVEAAAQHHPAAIIFADQCFTDESELENAGLALDKADIEFRWI